MSLLSPPDLNYNNVKPEGRLRRCAWCTKPWTTLLTLLLQWELSCQPTEPPTEPPEASYRSSRYLTPGPMCIYLNCNPTVELCFTWGTAIHLWNSVSREALRSTRGTLFHVRHRPQPPSMPSSTNWEAGQSLWARQTTRTSVLTSSLCFGTI